MGIERLIEIRDEAVAGTYSPPSSQPTTSNTAGVPASQVGSTGTHEYIRGRRNMDTAVKQATSGRMTNSGTRRQYVDKQLAKQYDLEQIIKGSNFNEVQSLINSYKNIANKWSAASSKQRNLERQNPFEAVGFKAYLEEADEYQKQMDDFQKRLEKYGITVNGSSVDASKYNQIYFDSMKGDSVGASAEYLPANGLLKDSTTLDVDNYLSHVDAEEMQLYNYLAANKPEEAEAYRQHLDNLVQQRMGGERAEQILDKYTAGGRAVSRGAEAFKSGLAGAYNAVVATATGEDRKTSASEYAAEQLRADLLSKGDEWWRTAGFDAMQSIGNMAPGVVAGMINPTAGMAVFGATSGTMAYQDKLAEGWGAQEARNYGLLVGASEAALGKVMGGIPALGGMEGGLLNKLTGNVNNAIAKAVLNGVGQMGSEALEEGLQTLIEPAIVSAIKGTPYDTPELKEVLYSAVLGAVTAAGFNAPNTAVEVADAASAYKGRYGADAQTLVNEAKQIKDVDRSLVSKAQSKLDKGKSISNNTAQQLTTTVNRSRMVDAVEAQINERASDMDAKAARSLANAVVAKSRNERLTNNQKKLIDKNKDLADQLAQEINPKTPADWARRVGMRGEEARAYGDRNLVNAVEQYEQKTLTGGEYAEARADLIEQGQNRVEYTDDFDYVAEVYGNTQNYDNFDEVWDAVKDETVLTQAQARAAWEAGRSKLSLADNASKLTRRGTGAVSFEAVTDGDVQYEAPTADEIDSFKRGARYQYLETLAKKIGVDIVFFKGGAEGINGKYLDGTVYLAIDASPSVSESVNGYVMLTAAHELTHYIREASPARYAELKDFIIKHIIDKGKVEGKTFKQLIEDKRRAYARANVELSVDNAIEEVVADACEMMLKDNALVAQLRNENDTLYGSVSKWLKKFMRKVRTAFKGLEAHHTEARAIEDSFRELQRIWNLGITEAAGFETAARTEAQNVSATDNAGDVQQRAEENIEADENHIDNRTYASVASRKVNAFQFDHPELHEYFVEAAQELSDEVQAAQMQDTVQRYRKGGAEYHGPVAQLVDMGLTKPRVLQCLDDIINDKGAENYADAKRVEIVLNDMLSNGWIDMSRRSHEANAEYIAAKERIAGGRDSGSWEAYLEEHMLSLLDGLTTEEELRREWEAGQTIGRYAVKDEEKFTKDKYFDRQIDQWESKADGTRIKVGELHEGSALNRVGFPATGMWFDVGKIRKSFGKHEDHLTKAILKNIPDLLSNPIAITEYRGPDNDIDNTVNVFGLLMPNKNTPIVVGVMMTKGADGQTIINKVRTVHARGNATINDDNILYLNEDKKRTRNWFQVCGNSVPLDGSKFGFIRSISYVDKKSNSKLSLKDDAIAAWTQARDIMQRRNELQRNLEDFKTTEEYNTETDKFFQAVLSGENQEAAFAEYREWEERSGYAQMTAEIKQLDEEYNRLFDEYSRLNNEAEQEEKNAAIAKSGLDEDAYYQKQAVKEFGYTPFFYDAGYIVPNGKMLNFSGEKGKHYGMRGQDHRAIGTIYPSNISGSEAMLKFMGAGNVRIMAETPGIDIAVGVEPTKEQYSTIGKFVNDSISNRYFSVDFTDSKGITIANLEYEGNFSATKVKADIKHYFETGEIRKQSTVQRFMYSLKDEAYMTAVDSGDMETVQRMVDEAAERAGYTVEGSHGTLSYFNIFDRAYGNPEGDWGKGFYFTNSEEDVEANYANEQGPDLRNKISMLAERLEGMEEYEGYDYEQLKDIARSRLAPDKPRTIKSYLKINNPVVVGNDGEFRETFFDFVEEYDEETDEYGEATGLLVDFVEALNSVLGEYDADFVDVFALSEYAYEGLTASELETAAKNAVQWVEDEEGNLISSEIVREAFERMGFDAIVDQSVYNKFGYGRRSGRAMEGVYSDTTHYIVFDSSQIKLADPVTYDDNGDVIPLSQRFNEGQPDIRYSIKDEAMSDRMLLANTLMTAAQNDGERRRLNNYKAQIDLFDEIQEQLEAAEEELSRAYRAGDKKAIAKAQKERNALTEKLIRADSKLTELQATKPLKELLSRVRQDTRRNTQRSTRERRDKSDLRKKIKTLHSQMSSQLLNPKENRYVPKPLLKTVAELLDLINLDSGRSEKIKAKLAELSGQYKKIANDNSYSYVFDSDVADMIATLQGVIAEKDDTSIYHMSKDELQMVYDTMKAINHTARTAVKLIGYEERRNIFELAKDMMRETNRANPVASKLANKYINATLRPDVFFKRMGGYVKNSVWQLMGNMLNEAQRKQTQIQMEGAAIFEELMRDTKAFDRVTNHKELIDIGLEDDKGNPVMVTRDIAMKIYMDTMAEDNARHLMSGGYTVPAMREYYKGRASEAFARGSVTIHGFGPLLSDLQHQLRHAETEAEQAEIQQKIDKAEADAAKWVENLRRNIYDQLGDYELEWIRAAEMFFNDYSQRVLNETTMAVYGFEKATVPYYVPIHTDPAYRQANFESISRDMSLENSGFMKARVEGAKNPMLAEGLVDVINGQIDKVAKYAAMMPAIRNFQKVYGKSTAGYESSVQSEVRSKFGNEALKYIENIITDLTSPRYTEGGLLGDFADRLRGNLAQAALTANPRVALEQATSYPKAAVIVGYGPLLKAMRDIRNNPTVDQTAREEIAKWTPLMWYRMQGYFDRDIGDLRKQDKLLKFLPKWIEFVEGSTVGQMWYAAQYYVEDTTNLERGTDEFMQETAKVFNRIVEQTQANYTMFQRPDILRNPNAIVKQLTMFMTERLQNANMVFDAVGTYNAYLKDFRNGENDVSEDDVKQAKQTVVRTASSLIAATASSVALKLLVDMLMYSMKGYRDEDEELTMASITGQVIENFFESAAGNFLWGSELFSIMRSVVTDETYYGISLGGVETFTDALNALVKTMQEPTWENWKKSIKTGMQMLGIPLNNGIKIYNAIAYRIKDVQEGNGWGSYASELKLTEEQIAKQLYNAAITDNEKRLNDLFEHYGTEAAADAALAKHIKSLYQNDELSAEEAMAQLEDLASMSAYDAGLAIDKLRFEKEQGFDYNDMKQQYLDGNITGEDAVKFKVDYGDKDKSEAEGDVNQWRMEKETGLEYGKMSDYLAAGDIDETIAAEYLIEYGGYDSMEAAEKKVSEWMGEIETGIPYDKVEGYYAEGLITRDELINYYMNYKWWYTEEYANQVADKRDFIGQDERLDDISVAAVQTYNEVLADADIDKVTYRDTWKFCNTVYADKDANGKSIQYSAMDKKLEYINSLNLEPWQKTLLAIANDISEKNVKKRAPWT